MRIQLQYNDLEYCLSEEDKIQIQEMPEPSYVQAEKIIETWNSFYGSSDFGADEEVIEAKILIKPYLKAKYNYPELLI